MNKENRYDFLGNQQPALTHVLGNTPVRRIFNHDIMGCTAEGVNGNHLYSARVLGMTVLGDLVQLHHDLRDEWPYITSHYARIGLSHAQDVIWSTGLEHISDNPDYHPSVFFFGEQENLSHTDDDWANVVNYINSKNNFVELAHALDVPIPRTLCFDQVEDLTGDLAAGFPYPCYLKAAVSVSGAGIFRCENKAELLHAKKEYAPDTPVQIQEEVRTDCFLNMQYQMEHGICHRLLVTEQILDGPAHQGNRYPARAEPWEIVEPMAEKLANMGFKDILAFDVAVVEENAGMRFLAIECNPRFNGASYPTAIALKLDIKQWEARNYRTWHRSLGEIDLAGLEYNPEQGEGVIIVNWGPVLVGKLMVMLVGTSDVRERLEMKLKHRLW